VVTSFLCDFIRVGVSHTLEVSHAFSLSHFKPQNPYSTFYLALFSFYTRYSCMLLTVLGGTAEGPEGMNRHLTCAVSGRSSSCMTNVCCRNLRSCSLINQIWNVRCMLQPNKCGSWIRIPISSMDATPLYSICPSIDLTVLDNYSLLPQLSIHQLERSLLRSFKQLPRS
jgi:hypothetical protein